MYNGANRYLLLQIKIKINVKDVENTTVLNSDIQLLSTQSVTLNRFGVTIKILKLIFSVAFG